MKPITLIAASTIAMLAGGLALAQPQPVPPAGGAQQTQEQTRDQRRDDMRQRRAERVKARLDERLTKLRADLKLKPEQTAAFDKLEALIRQRSEQRLTRFAGMREQRESLRHADMMERLDAMAKWQGERAAQAKELADTVRPLWATMADEQKTVLRRAVREAMAEGRERLGEMRAWRGGWHHDDEDGDRRGRRWRDRDDDRE